MDQCLEVILLGPGYGESVLINIGDDNWIVIDSCRGRGGRPAAIEYFEKNEVSLDNIVLIIATHWHDDHIWGLSELVEQCKNAVFCCGMAFSTVEFHSLVLGINRKLSLIPVRSGVKEIFSIFNIVETRRLLKKNINPDVKYCSADKVIRRFNSTELSHGLDVEIWALSPSDDEVGLFLRNIAPLLPVEGEAACVVKDIKPNQSCTVIQIKVGNVLSMLFGADLEEKSHNGWSKILASDSRPVTKSTIFKIPHHGSETGHHDQVWEKMIANNAICLITPYSRGHKLPKDTDLNRIVGFSDKTYVTQKSKSNKSLVKSKLVNSQLDGVAVSQGAMSQLETGQISVSLSKDELTSSVHDSELLKSFNVRCENGAFQAIVAV